MQWILLHFPINKADLGERAEVWCWGWCILQGRAESATAKQPNSKLKSLEIKQLLVEGFAAVVNDQNNDQIKAESITVEYEREGLVHSDASDASSAG